MFATRPGGHDLRLSKLIRSRERVRSGRFSKHDVTFVAERCIAKGVRETLSDREWREISPRPVWPMPRRDQMPQPNPQCNVNSPSINDNIKSNIVKHRIWWIRRAGGEERGEWIRKRKRRGLRYSRTRRRTGQKKMGFSSFFSSRSCPIADCKIPVAIKPFLKRKLKVIRSQGKHETVPSFYLILSFLPVWDILIFYGGGHLFRYKCYSATRGRREGKGDHRPLSERCA